MKATCTYCKKTIDKSAGHLNRANKIGAPVFCSRKCFGLSRRTNETEEDKKNIKAWYDGFLREARSDRQRAIDKRKNAEYFKKDYAANPEKYRQQRRNRQQQHNEYCRQPEYKTYKKEYDKKYRAKKHYGKYWEAFVALRDLQGIVDNRQAKQDQKSINKSQQRKRYAKKHTKRQKLEGCIMGFYQPS